MQRDIPSVFEGHMAMPIVPRGREAIQKPTRDIEGHSGSLNI